MMTAKIRNSVIYVVMLCVAQIYMIPVYAQLEWHQLELCPKSLTVDKEDVVLQESVRNNQSKPKITVHKGANVVLKSEVKDSFRISSLWFSSEFPEARAYVCRCEYEIKYDQVELAYDPPDIAPPLNPDKSFILGPAYEFVWLDKFEDISEKECELYSSFYNSGNQFHSVSSTHKASLHIFYDTLPFTLGYSIGKLFDLESQRSRIQSTWDNLQNERAIDSSCQSVNSENKKPPYDMLLIKNRWPTPGDHIDSIIFGQFSKKIPSEAFEHQICLSADSRSSADDISIFRKRYQQKDFIELNSSDHESIDDNIFGAIDLAQFFVDMADNNCVGTDCPEKIDLSMVDTGIYYVVFKSDVDNAINEHDEENNDYSGLRIEIDNFNEGFCAICPPIINDIQGNKWNLSSTLPDCDNCPFKYPSTSGRAYYDDQSYYASCVYERPGEDPVAIAWLRWQENLLAKDSIVFCNDNGQEELFLDFCSLDEFEYEFGYGLIPDNSKMMLGAYAHPQFPPGYGREILDGLISCYLERAIELDSFCNTEKLLLDEIEVNKGKVVFNVSHLEADTIYIENSGSSTITIETLTSNGDLDIEIIPSFGLPHDLQPSDSLEVRLKIRGGQNLEKFRKSVLNINTNVASVKDSVLICTQKLIIDVDRIAASGIIGKKPDTIYAGEKMIYKVRIVDAFTNLTYRNDKTIIINAKTIHVSDNRLKTLNHDFKLNYGSTAALFYDAFEGRFKEFTQIQNDAVLSGDVTVNFQQVNGHLVRPVEIKTWYASPLDFYIESVDFQQGIVDLDKRANLTFEKGSKKEYEALPFITDHDGFVQIKVNITNKSEIKYQFLTLTGIGAKIILKKDGKTITSFNLNGISIEDNRTNLGLSPGKIEIDDYRYDDIRVMKNVLKGKIDRRYFQDPGSYQLFAELIYPTSNPLIFPKANDTLNDKKEKGNISFVNTNGLEILVYRAIVDTTKYIDVNPEELFLHLRNAYPVQYENVILTDMGTHEFYSSSFVTLYSIQAQNLWILYNTYNQFSADAAIFIGDNNFINEMCKNERAIGCHFTGTNVSFSINKGEVLSHEMGHYYGLRDTYFGEGIVNGHPNPRRLDEYEEGNPIEEGNINLLQFLKAIDFSKSNQHAISDMMGSSSSKNWPDRMTWDYLYNKFFKLSNKAKYNMKFLVVSGYILNSGDVFLNPVILSENPPYIHESDPLGEYSIHLKSDKQEILQDYRFNIEFVLEDVGVVDKVPFVFYIPYEENSRSMDILLRDSMIHQMEFSIQPPIIDFLNGEFNENSKLYNLNWQARDPDSDTLYYSIIYTPDGEKYFPIMANVTNTSLSWKGQQSWFDEDEGKFVLTVSDGFNSVTKDVEIRKNNGLQIGSTNEEFSFTVSPNPFQEYLNLQFKSDTNKDVGLQIYNVHGKMVADMEVHLKPGDQSFEELVVLSWPSGVYLVQLVDHESGKIKREKILKVDVLEDRRY